MRPLKKCNHAGCRVLIPFNERYCDKHKIKTQHKNTTNEFANQIHQSNKWKRLSKQYRLKNPLCEICLSKGKYVLADSVDHIKPLFLGGSPYDWNNLQSLCGKCHSEKNKKERQKK